MSEQILIVDDEKEIADLIEVYLKNDGYTVHKFYNGLDALECIETQKMDLAILDVMLPDIDGFRICQKIREQYFYPIIILTAKVEDTDKIMGLTIGADDYITKPFNPLEVVARVKTQLRRYVRYNNAANTEEKDAPIAEHDVRGLIINKNTHKCTLYANALNRQGVMVNAHIKIDTGMHRLGIPSADFLDVEKVFTMKNLNVCGIFTHLCCSDSSMPDDIAFTRGQIDGFYNLIDHLKKSGINIPKLHIQSSYGFLNYPELKCSYVRTGVALYGVKSLPDDNTELLLDLRPVLSLKSRVVLIRQIEKGDSVGYGRSFVAERSSQIAILPIGYGDGFPRSLSNGNGRVLIGQYIVPVIGRICMDQLAIDITDVEGIAVGDIATLIDTEGCTNLSVDVVAKNSNSMKKSATKYMLISKTGK